MTTFLHGQILQPRFSCCGAGVSEMCGDFWSAVPEVAPREALIEGGISAQWD